MQRHVRRSAGKKKWLLVPVAVVAAVLTGGIAMAASGVGGIQFRVTSPVTVQALGVNVSHAAIGQTVTAGAKVVAEHATTLSDVALAVKGPDGTRVDFPHVHGWRLGTSQKEFARSRAFSKSGTYTFWFTYRKNGHWINVGPKQTFTVGKTGIPTPGSPAPSSPPSAPGSPTPTPGPTTAPVPGPTAPTSGPTPTPSPTGSSGCPVSSPNVPGGSDPWGGCFPGPGNTGVPAGAVLTPYTGPCTITKAGTVLDHVQVVGKSGAGSICSTLSIKATGVIIRDSSLSDVDVNNGDSEGATGSFTIVDSTVTNGARDQCACVGYHDFTALRVNVVGGNRSMYCISRCTIQDSWLHGQVLQGAQHGSGLRVEQFTTATHNTFACSYAIAHDSTTLGCSAPQNGYADFAAIKNNTMRNNLYISSNQGAGSDEPGKPNASFCSYGGDTLGKPHSADPGNGTNMKFISNVFQRGVNGGCGYYGPVTAFNPNLTGNEWSGNMFNDGTPIPVCSAGRDQPTCAAN